MDGRKKGATGRDGERHGETDGWIKGQRGRVREEEVVGGIEGERNGGREE